MVFYHVLLVVFTCDEGTWVRPGRWGYGVSSVLVGSEFCWTRSYFCSLKGRTPVEEEREVWVSMKVKRPAAAEKTSLPFRVEESMCASA